MRRVDRYHEGSLWDAIYKYMCKLWGDWYARGGASIWRVNCWTIALMIHMLPGELSMKNCILHQYWGIIGYIYRPLRALFHFGTGKILNVQRSKNRTWRHQVSYRLLRYNIWWWLNIEWLVPERRPCSKRPLPFMLTFLIVVKCCLHNAASLWKG